MTEAAISLEGVSKRYDRLEERGTLLRAVLPMKRPARHELHALRDIDLQIEPGETVGVLGHNGAGKTTLLRLLAGVTRPSEGHLRIVGRIAPLISVGVGFHTEMSGRENVLVNGMLLGLTRQQVEDRFDDIVGFSELEEFIDTPVKFYSSGMFMRLGFSVAMHVEPDVLLVDEVLAVGDLGFQFKCYDRMRSLQERGTTVVLVSHSMHAIRLLCPRVLVMRRGEVDLDGSAEDGVARHHELLGASDGDRPSRGEQRFRGGVQLLDRSLLSTDGEPVVGLPLDEPVVLRQRFQFEHEVASPLIHFRVLTDSGVQAYEMFSRVGADYRTIRAGEVVEIDIPFHARMGGGTFGLATTIMSTDGKDVLFHEQPGLLAYRAPRAGSVGIVELDAQILVDGEELSDHGDLTLGRASGSPT